MEKPRVHNFAERLPERFPGQVKLNEPLRDYTTYHVGGPAAALCSPATRQDLQRLVAECSGENIPFFILGSGSNLLVHDSGVQMVVIRLDRCCSEITHQGYEVYAGSGALVSALVGYCEENNLAGLDFMSGIPGTVGGALHMNAGAFVGEIGDRVVHIDALMRSGDSVTIRGEQAGFGYRRAINLQNKTLVGCKLQMLDGSKTDLERARQNYLERRASKQPLEYGSCGSVFKRPPGNYAGVLIEKAGCKGMRVGGAMVSTKHANFIVNYDGAKAADIYRLIGDVQYEVYRRFGVWLELEVKLLGFSTEEMKRVRGPHE